MDRGEAVTPDRDPGHEIVRRWVSRHPESWKAQRVMLGRLDDGRWYVEHVARVSQARAYPTRAQAEQVARQIREHEGGAWREVRPYGGI